jgi:hypothetical protein
LLTISLLFVLRIEIIIALRTFAAERALRTVLILAVAMEMRALFAVTLETRARLSLFFLETRTLFAVTLETRTRLSLFSGETRSGTTVSIVVVIKHNFLLLTFNFPLLFFRGDSHEPRTCSRTHD